MIEYIKNIDTTLFLFLNGLHNHFFDVIMYWISAKFTWIPFYLLLLFYIHKKFKSHTRYIVIAAIVLFAISDQLSVHLFKNVFLRYRPCHNLAIQSQVHTVGGCGGKYGFISSHASNVFSLAIFLSLIFKPTTSRIIYVLIFWAALVSYSRIYNGKHYPADVAVGALFGGLLAYVIYFIYKNLMGRLVDKEKIRFNE